MDADARIGWGGTTFVVCHSKDQTIMWLTMSLELNTFIEMNWQYKYRVNGQISLSIHLIKRINKITQCDARFTLSSKTFNIKNKRVNYSKIRKDQKSRFFYFIQMCWRFYWLVVSSCYLLLWTYLTGYCTVPRASAAEVEYFPGSSSHRQSIRPRNANDICLSYHVSKSVSPKIKERNSRIKELFDQEDEEIL